MGPLQDVELEMNKKRIVRVKQLQLEVKIPVARCDTERKEKITGSEWR